MKIYNVAILGFGNIGFFFSRDKKRKIIWSHYEAYFKNAKTQVLAIVEINKSKRQFIKKHFKNIKVYKKLEELYKAKLKIDIISICTPTINHYDMLKFSVKFNPKLIICEKPLCANVYQAKEMTKIIKKNKINLIVNHQLRFNKNTILARKLILDKKIGNLKSINSYYTSKIFNIGTHLIDLIRFLINKNPILLNAFFNHYSSKDPTVCGTLYFKNNIHCSINASTKKYNYIYEIDILGTKGRIKLIDAGKKIEFYNYQNSKNFTGYKELKKTKLPKKYFSDIKLSNDPMKNLFNEAINSIENKASFLPNVNDGYYNLLIAQKMIDSANEKKVIRI